MAETLWMDEHMLGLSSRGYAVESVLSWLTCSLPAPHECSMVYCWLHRLFPYSCSCGAVPFLEFISILRLHGITSWKKSEAWAERQVTILWSLLFLGFLNELCWHGYSFIKCQHYDSKKINPWNIITDERLAVCYLLMPALEQLYFQEIIDKNMKSYRTVRS